MKISPATPVSRMPGRGFTLVELMVAMAVLVVIGVLLAQVISATSQTTILSNRNVDAAAQARIVFDRMQLDLSSVLKRSDVDWFAENSSNGSVPLLRFISAVRSPGIADKNGRSNNRGLSLVSYEVKAHADNADSANLPRLCLTRAAMPIPWDPRPYTFNSASVHWGTATFMGLKSDGLPVRFDDAAALFPAALLPTPADYDVLAAGVFRVVIGFQLYPDGEEVKLSGRTGTTVCRGQVVYAPPTRELETANGSTPSPVEYLDLSYVTSLIVGVVAIDAETLRLLSAQNVSDLAGAFPLPSDGELPVKTWGPVASLPDALPSSVPLPARRSLRVYQRAFPINPFASGAY